MKTDIPQSYCYEEKDTNCEKFGRLYTWKAACTVCNMLGEGWRLPTNEEWRNLAEQYGGVRDTSEESGKAAYKTLLADGNAAFNALLGGSREPNGNFARLDDHGFYWTVTEDDSGQVWFYNFAKRVLFLNRHEGGEKAMACSVRCIKEVVE